MEERVRKNTPDDWNREIDARTKAGIEAYVGKSHASISQRINELDKEWDVERVLEVNMPVVALIGLALAVFVSPWWLLFPLVVLLFFLQHAIQGWCPPLPVFRKLGYRTRREIDTEKYALKLLRGDFAEAIRMPAPDTNVIYRAVSVS